MIFETKKTEGKQTAVTTFRCTAISPDHFQCWNNVKVTYVSTQLRALRPLRQAVSVVAAVYYVSCKIVKFAN